MMYKVSRVILVLKMLNSDIEKVCPSKDVLSKFLTFSYFSAKPNRKLTFLYLANDVIQNSKRKGPEFTKDFAPVIVEAFKHVSRYDHCFGY